MRFLTLDRGKKSAEESGDSVIDQPPHFVAQFVQVYQLCMPRPLEQIINAYRRGAPLAQAHTIPAAWYTDPRVFDLERHTVFTRSWQVSKS